MYPIIEIFPSFHIYTFGLLMSISFVIFFWLLHSFSSSRGVTEPIFSSIVPFSVGIILLGRLFYIIAEWREKQGYITDFFYGESGMWGFLKNIILMEDYNLSLMGGILGFFLVFLWKMRGHEKQSRLYLDIIILSYLLASILAYLGAFLGGQIYGVPSSWFGIAYLNPDTIVPYALDAKIFPLALFYMVMSGVLAWFLLRLERQSVPGYTGYIGLGLYGFLLFIGEFWSGYEDIFSSMVHLDLTQLGGVAMISISIIGLMKYSR